MIQICYELVTSFLLRRKHVAIRRLTQVSILFEAQCLVQMSELLLLGNQLNVIVLRVSNQFANLRRRQGSSGRADQRMRLAGERMLHIKGVHVEFRSEERRVGK